MRFAFFPGCSARSSGMEYAKSALELLERVGVEVVAKDFNCCGTHIVEEYSRDVWLALNARNLSLAEESEADIVTTCPACYQNLKKAKIELEDEETRKRVNGVLASINREYRGGVSVFHVIEILSRVADKLPQVDGGRVAAYYGCQILRPPEIGVDNPENPTIFEELLEKVGFEVVDFRARAECCGGTLLLTNSEGFKKRALSIIREAKKANAECIVTLCPLCQFSLEVVQDKIPVKPFTSLIVESVSEKVSERT